MSAEGFRLVIPQDMLNKLEAADQKLEQLGKTSQKTEAQVIASFKAMAEGINPFIQKLNEAQQTLANIKGGNINLGVVNTGNSISNIDKLIEAINQLSQKGQSKITINGIDATANQAVVAVDSINRLIDTLVKLQQMGGKNLTATTNLLGKETLKQMNSEARKMSKTIDKLNEATQKYTSTAGTLSEKIREAREAQRQFNEEAKRAAQANVGDLLKGSGKATTLNELKAYANQLKSTMANLDPKSSEWKRLNEILKATNNDIQRINQSMGAVSKTQSNLMNHAQQLRRALALVFSVSQITGYINKMVQVRGEFELQQRSLQAILQNKDEADKLWQQTVDLAVRSPFRVKELVSYTKQLAAYRVETEKLHDTTRMLSDVSAGLGVDMQRLILAYGQVKAANYLRGTELRQFSEAGINILGELAKYFTELEGRAVSVGEVFERVSKRMVAFSDVEEIFKRVTSEGGVFYRMQEIQSETIKGLISNLYDQVDLMLNEMGKSNESHIKGAIGLIRTLVENWEYVAETIKIAGAAWLVYKLQAQLAHEKNMLLAKDFGVLTDASQKQLKFTQLLSLSWKRVTQSIKTFSKALISNPWILAITAVLYAVTKLYSAWSKHQEQLNEITKQYKELRKEVTDISVKFTYASNLEEQKKELNKLIGVAKDKYNLNVDIDVKGLDEQEVSEKFNNLRNEILDTMAFAKLMSEAITKSDAWYKWGDDIYGAFEKFSSSAQEYSNVIRNNKNAIIEFLTETGRWSDAEKRMFADRGEYVKNETELEYIERLTQAYTLYYKELVRGGKIIGKNGVIQKPIEEVKALQEAASEYVKAKEKAIEQFDEFANNFNIPSYLNDEQRTLYVKTTIDQQGFDDFTREMWYKLANERFSVNITPKLSTKKELEGWQKQYNDFINTLDKFKNKDGKEKIIIAEMTVDTNVEQYINILKGQIDSVNKEIEAWDAKNARARATYTEEQINQMRLENEVRKQGYEWLVYTRKKETDGRDIFADQLRVIKEMYQAYKDLNKTFDETIAKQGALEKFGNAFKEAFGKTPEEMGFDLFSEEGVKKAYDYLIKHAPDAKKKIQAELAKGEIVWESSVKLKQEEDKELADQIADMFSGYELSLELQKLNIPPDLAKQLFNVDSLTLPELKENLQGMESQFIGTDMEKEYREALRKVDEMERKAQEERLKTYSKYLVKGMDERVRIKIEELRKLEEVEKDSEVYTPQQRADIRSAIQKETQEALDKQAWDEFKNTDLYISLFEDLEEASNRSLEIMIKRLNSLRESLKDLPPEQLKEIVKQLEKAQDELEGRNPFKKFSDDLKEFFGNIGKRKEAQQGVDNAEKQLTYFRAEAETQRDIIAQYESRIEKGDELTKQEEQQLENARNNLTQAEKFISISEKTQQSWQKILDSIKKGADGIGDAFEGTGELLQSLGSYVTDMANKWEKAFGLSDKAKDDIETLAGVAQGAGDMAIGIGKAIADPADIGAYMQAASGLMSIFSTFGEAHDKEQERKIEKETTLIKRLQKVYEDLGETIQNAYSLDTLNEATKMSRENLEAQINATERMIEAEQDKKDTDHERIEEWKEDIEEAKEAMKELEETRLQELGAFASDENKKSGAQAFLDAWMEAYKETGNGLSGLDKQFDEFFEDMIKKQLLQRASNKYLEGFFSYFDEKILENASSSPEDFRIALNDIMDYWNNIKAGYNKAMEDTAKAFGVAESLAGKEVELGGLQAGIQGITEDQADVLASYWSSVRLYTADTNQKVTNLITRLFDSEGNSNPMLAELRTQTAFIQEIRDVLGGVVRGGHSMGGTGLKVFVS